MEYDELLQRGAVHDDEIVHHVAQRGTDGLVGDDYEAVGGAAALLGAVGGEEGICLKTAAKP